ncbi:hypothetical protein FB451DRAFT_1281241 [Mycena latifolia]|nr:hypothetical protein FB451DRAFT_1281241 [Mycena latifolia]
MPIPIPSHRRRPCPRLLHLLFTRVCTTPCATAPVRARTGAHRRAASGRGFSRSACPRDDTRGAWMSCTTDEY